MAADALIFADQLERLNELADAVCDHLNDELPSARSTPGMIFSPVTLPPSIYDDMVSYFGDPHFVIPKFQW